MGSVIDFITVTRVLLPSIKKNLLKSGGNGSCGSSPIQLKISNNNSNNSSLSSSRLDLGSAESEIVKRNLITDFLCATSLPVNVPLHRSLEAAKPPTPMRQEFVRCNKNIRATLAIKLFATSLDCEIPQKKEKIFPLIESPRNNVHSEMIFHIEI